jgi:HAD superfamily hydrolase (TIGR01549 family)
MIKFFNKNKFDRFPDLVIFDLDNTLYPYYPAHTKAMQSVEKKFQEFFSVSGEEFFSAYDLARLQIKKRLGNKAASHSRLLYFQGMLEMMGLGSQISKALYFESTYWNEFLKNATLFLDAKAFLDDLRRLSIPIALVTDLTAQIQFVKLVHFELDGYFDYIVTSEESGFDKPNKSSFKLIQKKLNFNIEKVWMFGDDFLADIKASKLHMRAITFLRRDKNNLISNQKNNLDVSFTTFKDLRIFLKNMENDIRE